MEYRILGRTGLRVSEIGLGTSHNFRNAAATNESLCIAIVHEALAKGINFIDTASVYGESERVLGKALEGKRGQVVLATKVWQTDAYSARASVEQSLNHLRTDVIDLLQIHNMAGWREITPTLQEFQREGRVRFLGITERQPDNYGEVMEAMHTGIFDTIQIPYFLGETTCRAKVLPLAGEMNLGVIVMRPFSRLMSRSGLLRGGDSLNTGTEQLLGSGAEEALEFMKDYGCGTPGQGLLKYLLADKAVSSIIPATAKVERIAENTAASGGNPLPPEACARLEKLLLK
jgi:aryl-alcohol dehydrogenase-like predicted oxidoreductase